MNARRRPIPTLIAAQVLASTAAGLTLTVASVTVLEMSGSARIAGFAQTAIVVGASLLTLPVARAAARRGRRFSLVWAYVIAAIGALICAGATAAGLWLPFLLGLLGIGGGTVAGLAARFAAADAERRPERTATAIALVLWASTVGSVVGPNLVGLPGIGDSATAFVLLTGLYLASALIIVVGLPRPARVAEHAAPRASVRDTLAVFGRHRAARTGLALSAVAHITMVALMAMAPVHVHHVAGSDALIGLLMSAHLAAMYALSPVFGILVRYTGMRFSAVGSAVLCLVAAVALALAAETQPSALWAGLVLLGLAWSWGMVTGSALVTGDLSESERLQTQKVTDLTINIGGGAASIAAGIVVAGPGYAALSWGAAVLVLIATFGILGILRR